MPLLLILEGFVQSCMWLLKSPDGTNPLCSFFSSLSIQFQDSYITNLWRQTCTNAFTNYMVMYECTYTLPTWINHTCSYYIDSYQNILMYIHTCIHTAAVGFLIERKGKLVYRSSVKLLKSWSNIAGETTITGITSSANLHTQMPFFERPLDALIRQSFSRILPNYVMHISGQEIPWKIWVRYKNKTIKIKTDEHFI